MDDSGIRIILVKGENKITDRPDIAVLLLTIDSTNPKPIENLIFNAKVPKPYRKPVRFTHKNRTALQTLHKTFRLKIINYSRTKTNDLLDIF